MVMIDKAILQYKKTYNISTLVLERLSNNRDIYDSKNLLNRIDLAIKNSISSNQCESVWDNGSAARLVKINWDNTNMYIMLKQDRVNPSGWAAITALTEQQFLDSYSRWQPAIKPHPEVFQTKREPQGIAPRATYNVPAGQYNKSTATITDVVIFYYKTTDGVEHYEKHPHKIAALRSNEIVNQSTYEADSLETYVRLRHEIVKPAGPMDF